MSSMRRGPEGHAAPMPPPLLPPLLPWDGAGDELQPVDAVKAATNPMAVIEKPKKTTFLFMDAPQSVRFRSCGEENTTPCPRSNPEHRDAEVVRCRREAR